MKEKAMPRLYSYVRSVGLALHRFRGSLLKMPHVPESCSCVYCTGYLRMLQAFEDMEDGIRMKGK